MVKCGWCRKSAKILYESDDRKSQICRWCVFKESPRAARIHDLVMKGKYDTHEKFDMIIDSFLKDTL